MRGYTNRATARNSLRVSDKIEHAPARVAPPAGAASMAQVEITAMTFGPFGVGRLNGKAVMVPNAAPGDLLEVTVVHERAGYLVARADRVLNAGAARRTPPCPYLPRCGGCDWQQISYPAQARFKADAVFGPVRGRLPDAVRLHRVYLERFFSREGPAEAQLLDGYYGCGDSLILLLVEPVLLKARNRCPHSRHEFRVRQHWASLPSCHCTSPAQTAGGCCGPHASCSG